MAKVLREAAVTTRAARAKLPVGVHFKGIDAEVHLGYRRGKRGGVWFVRWRSGAGYKQMPLGTADDEIKAGTLDYEAARRAAKAMVEKARIEEQATEAGPAPTVRSVVEAYIADRDARDSKRKGRPVRSDAGQRLERYVLGLGKHKKDAPAVAPLADLQLHMLEDITELKAWRSGLPEDMKATTKQRLINDLKAALNGAWAGFSKEQRALNPGFPAIIKDGLKASSEHDDDDDAPIARDNQILTDAQIGLILQTAREIDTEQRWEGDLFRLVVVLAATGARFSQIARMRVGDVQRAQGRLLVPVSRKGKGKSGSTPVPVGSDVLNALLPIVTGRTATEPLLERWRLKQVAGSINWERAGRGPWQAASEITRPWGDIRERAGMPDVIPYALRHSSIVRGIRANLPIRLVAALHDTSVAMIERHYSRWIVDGLEEMAARAVVPLVPEAESNKVVQIRGQR